MLFIPGKTTTIQVSQSVQGLRLHLCQGNLLQPSIRGPAQILCNRNPFSSSFDGKDFVAVKIKVNYFS